MKKKTDYIVLYCNFTFKFYNFNYALKKFKKNPVTLTDVFDMNCGIGDFRHIFCPQVTQEPLRATMKPDYQNNCLLMYCHKLIMDILNSVKIAKRFACANEHYKVHSKNFE